MFEARDYQINAVKALWDYFRSKKGNPLVVIPTAGGKSYSMARFVREAIEAFPDTRILSLTHVKELVAQNCNEILEFWESAPAGIYHAGIGRREINAQICFAGVHSIYKKADELGRVDLILVDEAHMIPTRSGTMYRQFLDAVLEINPKCKIIGFTATPYRLGTGLLHTGGGALFTDIAFEVSVRELVERGFLSPVLSKATKTELSVEGVGKRGGEFIDKDLNQAVNTDDLNRSAVDEFVNIGLSEDRQGWMAFCVGVDHAERVCVEVRRHGVSCEVITGKTPKAERDQIIEAFKAREIRCLTNANVLTTGFNARQVDLIAGLRPTNSTSLYVQMVGRGMRLSPETGKENCRYLDYAGNVARHGPIDLVSPEDKEPGDGGGPAPVKVCPDCDAIVYAGVRKCPECGYEFPYDPEGELKNTAASDTVLTKDGLHWVDVRDVAYIAQTPKPGKRPTMRVEYLTDKGVIVAEWVCLEHGGFPRQKAVFWWQIRSKLPTPAVPETVACGVANAGDQLRKPTRIGYIPKKFPDILGVQFGDRAFRQSGSGRWNKIPTSDTLPEKIQPLEKIAFLKALDRSNKIGMPVTHQATAPNYAPAIFTDLPEFSNASAERVEAVMASLFRDEVIETEPAGQGFRIIRCRELAK